MRVVAFFVLALLASVVNASSSCEADLNGDGICDPYGVRPLEDDGTISRIIIDIGGGNKSVSGVFELGDGGLSVGYLLVSFRCCWIFILVILILRSIVLNGILRGKTGFSIKNLLGRILVEMKNIP